MPPTRHISRDRPIPSIPQNTHEQYFSFPANNHLLITTPRHVFAWDSSCVHTVFQSRRGSIVAAREAKDGSGVLAVASSNVVVMHDPKRGQEKSWGLSTVQEGVRHLEYAPDAKSLFLTTTTDGTIQHYSPDCSRMLDPAHRHEGPLEALAVSPTGHMIVSSSQTPPIVFVKSLVQNTPSLTMHPTASLSPVTFAAFHPERPDIFLLAFRDGVVAAYDATKMPRHTTFTNQQHVNDGEISHMQTVHRAVISGDESLGNTTIAAPIAGAAFLPGFKTRAVTAGRDGRCKLIDFGKDGVVLRTWHAKAPLTSISVLAVKAKTQKQIGGKAGLNNQRNRASSSETIAGSTGTNCLIAVSRLDGKLCLYDGVGLLLAQKTVSAQEEPIIGLEWAQGPSPKPVGSETVKRRFSDAKSVVLNQTTRIKSAVGQPQNITKADAGPKDRTAHQTVGFTYGFERDSMAGQPALHPDEVEAGTVRYTPASNPAQVFPARGTEYHDIFSPIKPDGTSGGNPAKQRITSPAQNRPVISSQTFVRNPRPDSGNLDTLKSTDIQVGSPVSAIERSQTIGDRDLKRAHRPGTKLVPIGNTSQHKAFANFGDGPNSNHQRIQNGSANAKVLADLRRLADHRHPQHKHGTLSSYAVSQRMRLNQEMQTLPPAKHSVGMPTAPSVHACEPSTWPTDSCSASSPVSRNAADDIWLTSDSEDDRTQRRRHRMKPLTQSPACRPSRPRPAPKGQISTAPTKQQPQAPSKSAGIYPTVDGSTEEEMFSAATHLSPDGILSPASDDVRELFPRHSSLSPNKRKINRKKSRRPPQRRNPTVTAVAVNAAQAVRLPKSPWARAKARKSGAAPVIDYTASGVLPRSEAQACLSCPETTARVQSLESEVAHLKGEVLAMKAVLRRNGLPLPGFLR